MSNPSNQSVRANRRSLPSTDDELLDGASTGDEALSTSSRYSLAHLADLREESGTEREDGLNAPGSSTSTIRNRRSRRSIVSFGGEEPQPSPPGDNRGGGGDWGLPTPRDLSFKEFFVQILIIGLILMGVHILGMIIDGLFNIPVHVNRPHGRPRKRPRGRARNRF